MKKKSKPSLNVEYASVIKCCEKSNITTDNISEIMLMQIPGLSNVTAKAILCNF